MATFAVCSAIKTEATFHPETKRRLSLATSRTTPRATAVMSDVRKKFTKIKHMFSKKLNSQIFTM